MNSDSNGILFSLGLGLFVGLVLGLLWATVASATPAAASSELLDSPELTWSHWSEPTQLTPGVSVWTDPATGCQYLRNDIGGQRPISMTPRLSSTGTPMCSDT